MMNINQINVSCCAECGGEEGGGVSLKTCKSCMQVKYCNPTCQKNHWAKHKKECKLRAAELRDEALFKDPPAKEDCPICFLPMPVKMISCICFAPATRSTVPIYDFAIANEEFATVDTEAYYSCCGKTICRGCIHSCRTSGNIDKCPFCNSDGASKTHEEMIEDLTKRVTVNDPASICLLANSYHHGINGLQQDRTKATELYTKAADLGYNKAHNNLGGNYYEGGDLKKAKFHYEAAAMAGHEVARYNLGRLECCSGNMERAVKHLKIAASAGEYDAMYTMTVVFEKGYVSQESMDTTLTAYNNSCAEVRSKARDAYIRVITTTN